MKIAITTFILILLVILFIVLVTLPAGCSLIHTDPGPIIEPITPTQVLYRTVMKTDWLVTLAILGIGGGAYAFFNGHLKGIKFAAACLVVLGITLWITRYGTWVAWITGACAIGLPALTIYLNRKALLQIITGVQNVKDEGVLVVERQKANRLLSKVQSPETQAIVKKIKEGGNL
ncbi:MAG TPA: hypothetical protein VMW50_08365 [Dehalococcoidia bacterium]|nr:hypothetical protein [Dehalococcoidia bacterium]